MRILYFDIDGTILLDEKAKPKRALADGVFESAVLHSGVEKLVCVGNFVGAARTAEAIEPTYNSLGVIFDICRGVFSDKSWFCSVTSMIEDPMNRAREVDLEEDWWYVDDLAEHYFRIAGRVEVFQKHIGKRIFVPTPGGNGKDVLAWLSRINSSAF
jgi:hypothetical protein